MTELSECKSKRKCIFCKKDINKGDLCNSTRHGTVCKPCYKRMSISIEKSIADIFPDDECTCPLCKGTGKVNKLLVNNGLLRCRSKNGSKLLYKM